MKFFFKKNIIYFFCALFYFAVGSFFATIIFFLYHHKIYINNNRQKSKTIIIDRFGNEIYNESNEISTFSSLPNNLIKAFLAAEDKNFFFHRGISIKAIIRSIIINIIRGKYAQGASTITQQFIKLKNGNFKKTILRKLKDQIEAILIESHYSKEEIFESYLNALYFGYGIYGVACAAKEFWNKSYKDLSLSESAILAGIIQLPEKFNPFKNLDLCIKKRNLILKRMLSAGFIDQKEYEGAINEPVYLRPPYSLNDEKHIFVSLNHFLSLYKEGLLNEKYYINTTFDRNIEQLALTIFKRVVDPLKVSCKNLEGALTIIDLKTGEVVAFINGSSSISNKARAYEEFRQIGSTIKPLVFYYAFLNGDNEQSIYYDTPLDDSFMWNPHNYNDVYRGPLTIEEALIESNNIIPIRVLIKYGAENLNKILEESKLFKKNYPYLSLALGCVESNTLNMAALMGVFQRGGILNYPYYVKRVMTESGSILYKNRSETNKLLNSEYSDKIKNILEKTAYNICFKLNRPYFDGLIGKTGTTNGFKSCWFSGATKNYALSIYLGTDNQESLTDKKVRSLWHCAKIGIDILEKLENINNK
jgi:penicillin-binding protein 1A